MNRLRVSVMVVGLIAAGSVARGTPLSYEESVSGDLALPSPTFLLDIGANTISGTTEWKLSGEMDLDTFLFVVPSGTVLASINFAFGTTGTAIEAGLFYLLFDTTPVESAFGDPLLDVTGTGSVAFLPGIFPLPADTYKLSSGGASKNPALSAFSTDYTWTLNVASVPDSTSTLGLLGVAWAGLASIGRLLRRRAALSCSPRRTS